MLKGILGIFSLSIGGTILVYILLKIYADIAFKYSTLFNFQNALPANLYGIFIGFLLIGIGFWLIIKDKNRTITA